MLGVGVGTEALLSGMMVQGFCKQVSASTDIGPFSTWPGTRHYQNCGLCQAQCKKLFLSTWGVDTDGQAFLSARISMKTSFTH